MRTRLLPLVSLLTLAATAQENPHAKPTTGTVTGHDYSADTNSPARMASVQQEAESDAGPRSTAHQRYSSGIPGGGVVQTALDGSFALSDVSPGSYYVVVTASGYLSPRADDEDFDNAQPAAPAGQPPISIPKVDLEADQTANVEVRLERGAAVSGTIRFDDGSPAANLRFTLLHKSNDQWTNSRTANFTLRGNDMTDDLGHYRISGLRDREYILQVTVSRTDFMTTGVRTSGTRVSHTLFGTQRSSLIVYSGDATRRSDAVPFKLSAGEERAGEDITIPLSKLHSVSGAVTAYDGHAINAGNIQILTPDGKEPVASAEIGSDGLFNMESVPVGSYLLRVVNPRDKEMREVSMPGEHGPMMTMLDEKVLHRYGDLEQTLKVERDIPALNLTVPEETKANAKPAAQ